MLQMLYTRNITVSTSLVAGWVRFRANVKVVMRILSIFWDQTLVIHVMSSPLTELLWISDLLIVISKAKVEM
jgi:hypothetical protein